MSESAETRLEYAMPFGAGPHCATGPQLVLAATNGPASLPAGIRRHLVEEDCPVCDQGLSSVWLRRCPTPLILRQIETFPAAGTYGQVLRMHVDACTEAACQQAASALATTPGAEATRPEGLTDRVWQALREWLGGLDLTGARAHPAIAGALRGATSSRDFEGGLWLTTLPDRSDAVALHLEAADPPLPVSERVRIVLVDEDGTVLADEVVDPSATGAATLHVDVADAMDAELTLLVLPAAATG